MPYLIEREGTNNENLPETHDDPQAHPRRARRGAIPSRMLLAEANQWPEDTKDYFGDGDECHMAFHFPLMPRMYMAIAQRGPLPDHRHHAPDAGDPGELPVGDLPAQSRRADARNGDRQERDYLWQTYAADRRARINLGIRRRLAPLLERDRRRIELMNCLLLSMPGTPVIYYGDEIGMGDNIHLGDRDGVRTPMQWSPDRNGGFSRADPAALVLPPIMDPLYGYEAVNVEAQTARPAFAAQLDAAHAGGAPPTSGVRARHAAFPLSEQPQGPRLSARVRGRDRSCASPTSRARRRRSSSICPSSPAACRSS